MSYEDISALTNYYFGDGYSISHLHALFLNYVFVVTHVIAVHYGLLVLLDSVACLFGNRYELGSTAQFLSEMEKDSGPSFRLYPSPVCSTFALVSVCPIFTIFSSLPTRKFLILVNPYGGSKMGVRTFEDVVKPMFEKASANYDYIMTTHATHAFEVSSIDRTI